MKVLTVLGARPQFIKAAMVSRAIREHNTLHPESPVGEVVVHTGQHFDAKMSAAFFDQLGLPQPDHNLAISGLPHGAMTGRMLENIEALAIVEKPNWVLVYGDTNSTLAGALAAAKLHVPVAHVEAGLRSHNLAMPEEINRTLTDRISSLLFCPTTTAVENLHREGFPFVTPQKRTQRIENVGDVMVDAVLHYRELARQRVSLSAWSLQEKNYALCTLHRQENTDDPKRLANILSALRRIAAVVPVLLPLHPRTRQRLSIDGHTDWLTGLRVTEPVPYLEMQRLQMSASVILTDSGGIQKEAYLHNVPCITFRDETEWVETVETGWNQVVGTETERIVDAFRKARPPKDTNPGTFGNGATATAILERLLTDSYSTSSK